jgi:hypothetical protein
MGPSNASAAMPMVSESVGMRVDGQPGVGTHLDGERGLGDEVPGIRADNAAPDDPDRSIRRIGPG